MAIGHRELAQQEIERCMEIAAREWRVVPRPAVRWTLRGNRCNGRYQDFGGCDQIILLNENRAILEGPGYQQTVGHEYAHAVQYTLARGLSTAEIIVGGYRGHGKAWVRIMESFGLPPLVRSNYQTARAPMSVQDEMRRQIVLDKFRRKP